MTNDYPNLAVCTEDFTLRGTHEGKEHRCVCQHKDDEWRGREWAGYDIAAELDLCHLCVRASVRSGSRWSWYACDQCRSVDNQVACAILRKTDPRHRVLPLGRHSMMNGIALGARGVESDESTKQFVDSVTELSEFWNRLSEWRKDEAQRLTDASGFSDLESVPLDRWLEANGASQGASVDAWCRFVEEDLPELPKLDDLCQARRSHLDRRTS